MVALMAATSTDRDAPVRQRSLRTHNLALVLRQVAVSRQPVSRADVAAATGLTRATVSAIVDELLAGRLLAEVDPAPRSGAGRPGMGLCLATRGPAGLGLEVNVDYLAACVVDLTGRVRHRQTHRSDQRGRSPESALDDVAGLAGVAMRAAAADDLSIAGVTLAVPGLVRDGMVHLAPGLGWREVDARAALLARAPGLAAPERGFSVDNEANLAAVAELLAAWEPGSGPSFLYISGEVSIGAGIVLDGELYRGGRGFAGELGHVTIRPDGRYCRCGARGCLEAYANQEALLRTAGLSGADQPVPARTVAPGDLALTRLVALASAGAHPALMALEEAGAALGVAAADVVNLLDVDTVVLGGSYAPMAPWLVGPIRREIQERVPAVAWAEVQVRPSVLGPSAAVVGAAGSVVRAIRAAPASWLAARA
jgi:predicted NBD/HSP70 family sugar kinase